MLVGITLLPTRTRFFRCPLGFYYISILCPFLKGSFLLILSSALPSIILLLGILSRPPVRVSVCGTGSISLDYYRHRRFSFILPLGLLLDCGGLAPASFCFLAYMFLSRLPVALNPCFDRTYSLNRSSFA